MLTNTIFSNYKKNQNEKQFLEALKDFWKISIHKSVEPYLLGKENFEGTFFNINSFEKCHQNIFTYQKLFKRFDDSLFPAVLIGGDKYGIELWLVLTNGKVISLHHDATFYEMAHDITASDSDTFVKKFSESGSVFDVESLAQFQKLTANLDKKDPHYERMLLQITAESLGWSISKLSKSINKLPLESIYSSARDFIENSGFEDLIAAEKKISQIEKNKTKSLDLSVCFLETLPASLLAKKSLESLNLSSNALKLTKELTDFSLKKLDLSDCQLETIPALPASLEYLVMSENALKSLKGLETCKNLQYLDIRGNAIDESEIDTFKKKHPNCKVLYQEKEQSIEQEILDLSYQNIKKLPKELAKQGKQLKKLILKGNPNLNFEEVFSQLAEWTPQLQVLNLQECKLIELPKNILKLQSLEILQIQEPRYGGNSKLKNELDFDTYFSLLNGLVNLQELPLKLTIPWESNKKPSFEKYLESLAFYSNLKVFLFPENIRKKTQMEAIFKTIKDLPIHTFVWEDLNFEEYNHESEESETYQISGLEKFNNVKNLIWQGQSYSKNMPDFIFDFTNLEKLLISDTSFESIPSKIQKLKNLKELHFIGKNGHYIQSGISESLSKLEKLEVLKINYLYLDSFPKSITNLPNLRELNLRKSNIKKLPENIGDLSNLEVLDLSENDLLEFPKSFGKLKKLKKLYLRDFGTAETLPLSFENLEELTLNGKNLDYTEVLSDISKLKSLKKLNIIELRNEKKFHIPKEFADLDNLEELCLYHSEGMKDLTQTFDIISKLKNLTSLNMTFYEWGLKEKVPASIADFKKLHTIDKLSVRDLPQNLLSELFTYLGNIKTLKKINAHQGINYLPPEIGLLTSLEELQLSTTNIKSYPKELLSLTQLKKLDLRGCGLSSADKQFIKKSLKETDVRL